MKRQILLFCLALFSFATAAFAQVQSERRVYFLDVTGSMKQNKIWDEVRNKLKIAIDRIEDETTELIVIPFTDNAHTLGRIWKQNATKQGKDLLKEEIDKVNYERICSTNLFLPLNEFCSLRVDDSKVTYMFLMTDGKDEEDENKFRVLLSQWGDRFGERNVYGFYVMLHPNAVDNEVLDIINKQKHLWQVQTADVNIKLIRLENTAAFNVRNDKCVEIPVFGDCDKGSLNIELVTNQSYDVQKFDIVQGKLQVYLVAKQPLASLPEREAIVLSTSYDPKDPYTFLVTDKIKVTCLNKKERSLKISFK